MQANRLGESLLLWWLLCASAPAAETPLPQSWDYARALRPVARQFHGRAGVVLHVGDSITYANPYGAWARQGAGKTADDVAILKWMHSGADDDRDGWHLARFDHPDGGRSYTACGGIRADQMLAGGKQNLPSLEKLLDQYRPQMVVLMLGTNDVSAGRKPEDYRADMDRAVKLMLDRGIIPILSTIPPHIGRPELAKAYNLALRDLARERQLPLVDYEAEILRRRPDDWNGTLLNRGDVHPSAGGGGVDAASAPTAENLRTCGYLLRGWLSVQKIAEVKRQVLDVAAEEPPATDATQVRPQTNQAESLRLPVTRDNWFSEVGAEALGNNGGSAQLKVKSIQEMSLLDVDASPLTGRTIESATLHLHGRDLKRVTVSSFAAEWTEGTATGYAPQPGSSSFRWQRNPDLAWTRDGGDLCAVMLGQGGTVWRMADATPVDAQGWQHVPVDPLVVAARVAGLSQGFLVFDDTGTEWERHGERVRFQLFPNRYFKSRESGAATAPYLTVVPGSPDREPPARPTAFAADAADLPAGEARVSWLVPPDQGPAGTIGFRATLDDQPVPQYLLPMAGKPGTRVSCRLRDFGLAPGAGVRLQVRAVDGAGNAGEPASYDLKVSAHEPKALPGESVALPAGRGAALPKLGASEVAILDPLDKVHPVNGELIPPQAAGYLAANHLWNAADKTIRLQGAKNEFVGFQVLVRGPTAGVRPRLEFKPQGAAAPQVSFSRYAHVQSAKGPLPDPIVPLDGALAVPSADEQIAGQRSGSLLCEVYLPHDIPAGQTAGMLRLESPEGRIELPVELTVWDFTLPDQLSFLPEMNCYGLPEHERAYYRLAQLHRTVLNRVPYFQNGNVADGCAPKWNGQQLDWQAWDERFGPLLDGSAFADLPRGSVPIECFYLPLNENWPSPMAANYNGDYWADRAFPPAYRQTLVEVARQMAAHFHERRWHDTLFQFFLNGKNNFKANGWSRGSSPWLLDEPANFQDYWALAWFGEAFHAGTQQAAGKAKLLYRCDISRPQWQRDALDHVLDYNVVAGGAFRQFHRLVLDRRQAHGQIVVEYGSSNAIEASNMQAVGWAIDSWCAESDGILPWQTIGNDAAWQRANAESLFYPPRGKLADPAPSIRLKAYRRGQQDAEYLTLLTRQLGEPRWAVGQRVREALQLTARREDTGFVGGEDAGVITYADLLPQQAAALRERLGRALSAAKPPAARRLVEFRTPLRTAAPAAARYASGHQPVAAPAAEASGPTVNEVTLQGRAAVRDALITFEAPEKQLGSEPRGNALRRADECNAFLVRFELAAAKTAPGTKLKRARLCFYVWDPSSQGKTSVVAARIKTAWDEQSCNWRQPAVGKKWLGATFDPQADTADPTAAVTVQPDQASDTADPPVEYQLDVTETVRAWLSGKAADHGLAILPVIDRSVDEGYHTRIQIYASEHRDAPVTPKLVLEFSSGD